MKHVVIAVCLLALVFVSGCGTVALDAQNLTQPVLMNSGEEREYTVVNSFEVRDKAGWVIIVPVNKPAGDRHQYLGEILDEEVRKAGGDAVINVKIRVQSDIGDYLISFATLGIYVTRTAIITGDVIKYN